VRAGAVLLARPFLERVVCEAAQRAALAVGTIVDTLPETLRAGSAQRQVFHPEPPPGSSPDVLKLRQAEHRQAGEKSTVEQLEIERQGRLQAEHKAEIAIANERTTIAKSAALEEENSNLRQALNETIRNLQRVRDDACELEAQVEQLSAIAECIRADNPTSPPELRLAFECWRYLTDDGLNNPSGKGGRGVHGLVLSWVNGQSLELNKDQLARLQATVSWRKRGAGAIPSS
jgi:multidrug efflux pump subunit AcrA (membrane-fusion protein)